ncbi:2-methylcitrate dehydratase PrpD [Litoreibacter meonggei]|uniref:2-methylcitrate dehydratase PrpD n=1 Tax=Litoreibacter meonggei TaxID=1049199 RepID=A0A497WV82_9RHOB|nr:MmgE/PrpD family protein [Litoreibacter meonggei]RLJ59904.1 2-methylcitrate dehydratase PrpD [Litoreibacter meonggei]
MTEMETLNGPKPSFSTVNEWLRGLNGDDIPPQVMTTAKLLVLDLLGVLAAAHKLDAGRIARDHAVRHWAAGADAPHARLAFDARAASLPGAAFAMATQLDNLDAHDGWQPSKGHAGAALLPALMALAEDAEELPGREALVLMIAGYEISYRAAAALHATVPDYHTSGAWNALGCVAMGARLRGVSNGVFRHALGIAEYHAPRSQMMREIANPTMLHDGTGFGAPVGLYALLVAEDGFTGAPAATFEFDDAAEHWSDLGQNWLTCQQYVKPYPICRWAHAPIDAALGLRVAHNIDPQDIVSIEVHTFKYSADLSASVPDTSPKAQYSLAWPVACAFARGGVGVDEVMPETFGDPELIRLTNLVTPYVDAALEADYPARRQASVRVILRDGRCFDSGVVEASGGPDPQPTEAEIVTKFRRFAGSVLGADQVAELEKMVMELDSFGADFKALVDLVCHMKVDA